MSAKRPLEVDDQDQDDSRSRPTGSGGPFGAVRSDKSPFCGRHDPGRARQVFYNELIMKKISGTLPPEDLLTLRGTCTTWSRIFATKLKATHPPVRISGSRRDEPTTTGQTCADQFSRYVALMQSPSRSRQDIPFTKYQIEENEDSYPEPGVGGLTLWRNPFEVLQSPLGVNVGQSITFLQIHWHHMGFISVRDLRRLIFDQTPRLETLELRPCRMFGFDNQEQGAVGQNLSPRAPLRMKRLKITSEFDEFGPAFGQLVLDTIVGAAGGLEYISIKIGTTEMAENLVSSTIMALFDPKVNLNNLKALKISRVTAEELVSLHQLANRAQMSLGSSLRLEALFLGIVVDRKSDLDERRYMTLMFNEFLASQGPTLRKLYLEFVGVEVTPFRECSPELQMDFTVSFEVPRMEGLHTFKIFRTEMMRVDLEFEGWTQEGKLGSTFPGLKSLSYSHYEKDYNDDDDGSETPSAGPQSAPASGADENFTQDLRLLSHPTVTHLCVTAACPNFTRFNSSLFPAVTWFQLALISASAGTTQETVAQIWTLFPNLKRVYILIENNFGRIGGERGEPLNLDQLLSGVNSPDVTRRMAQMRAPPGRAELQKLADKYKTPGRPCISDLKQLEELTIFTEGCKSNRTGLTDVGAWLGLGLGGPHLKKVEIYGPDIENNISDQCMAFLQSVHDGWDAVINI